MPWVMHLAAHGHEQHVACRPGDRVLRPRTRKVERVTCRNCLLYGACWRAARALGYQRLVTYTLVTEPGTSLRAAGWRLVGEVRGRSWSCPSRPRVDRHPTQAKLRWEAVS